MFCTKCGQQLPDGCAFCPSCGAAVNAPKSEAPVQPQAQPTYQSPVQPQAQPYTAQPQNSYQQPYSNQPYGKSAKAKLEPAKINYYIWAGAGVIGLVLMLMPFANAYFISASGYGLLEGLSSIGEADGFASILIILMIIASLAMGVTGILLASGNKTIKEHLVMPILVGESAIYTVAAVIIAIIIMNIGYGVSVGIGLWLSIALGIALLVFFFIAIKKLLPKKAPAQFAYHHGQPYGQAPQAPVQPAGTPVVDTPVVDTPVESTSPLQEEAKPEE